jgi:hypothetical protein
LQQAWPPRLHGAGAAADRSKPAAGVYRRHEVYDALAPGKETIRSQAYSLLRTVLGSAASARPKPLIPYTRRTSVAQATSDAPTRFDRASLQELETIVVRSRIGTS